MKGEPSCLEHIIREVQREGVSLEVKKAFIEILNLFRDRGREMIISSPELGQLSPDFEKAFHVYVNGNYMHGHKNERDEWKKYVGSRMEPYFYNLFVCSLINKANAVNNLYNLLTDHQASVYQHLLSQTSAATPLVGGARRFAVQAASWDRGRPATRPKRSWPTTAAKRSRLRR
jgi:hypothetical protein